MNKIIKNTLILTAITVVSGLLLGVVYNVTKEPIAQAQENTKQEAYRAVLADASSFETLDFDAESTLSLLTENGYTSDTITEVAEGKDNSGETIGYVISVQSSEAYDGTLDLSVGIATDGTVKGVEMLSIKADSKEIAYVDEALPEVNDSNTVDINDSAALEQFSTEISANIPQLITKIQNVKTPDIVCYAFSEIIAAGGSF